MFLINIWHITQQKLKTFLKMYTLRYFVCINIYLQQNRNSNQSMQTLLTYCRAFKIFTDFKSSSFYLNKFFFHSKHISSANKLVAGLQIMKLWIKKYFAKYNCHNQGLNATINDFHRKYGQSSREYPGIT